MATVIFSTAHTAGGEQEFSGFTDDYSILQPATGGRADLLYTPPGVFEKLGGYSKIMIDQPEIFVAPDSPYKGVKPDQAKALADGFREILTESFAKHYEVVEEPGEGVLYMRLGLTGMYLKRKVKFYNFKPVGAVALGVKSAASTTSPRDSR